MEYLDLSPIPRVSGTVLLPGSKSISNRTLLLAALAEGVTEVKALLASDDTQHMLAALKQLGVNWAQHGDSRDYRVEGVGGEFPVKQADLFLGNAGTAFRPLTAALALSHGEYRLSGVPRMHERPIGDLVDALRQLGADIAYLGNEGYPPLAVKPAQIKASGRVQVRGNVSSQFLTALLMAAPLARQDVTIEVVGELISKPYIEITLNLMRRFGVEVERQGWQAFTIRAGQTYRSPGVIHVEGDASSALPISLLPAPSARDRCGSKAWAKPASRATCALPRRWSRWAPKSPWATTGSRRALPKAANSRQSTSTATIFPMPR